MSSKSLQVVSTLKRKRDASPDSIDASSSSSELGRTEDAPVLSHAARRKQKKKAPLNEAAPTSLPAKTQKKEDDAFHPVTSKRQNSIWVGNLSYKTTPESLRRFFDQVGEITRVHLPTKLGKASPGESATRENRGFAYVDFATLDAKKAAVAMSEMPLEGRRLLIKDGDSFEGRPVKPGMSLDGLPTEARGRGQTKFAQRVLSAQKQPPAPTLFLGNLGFETTTESIRVLLEAHRAKEKRNANAASSESATTTTTNDDGANDPWIRKIRMGTFEDSGLCKGSVRVCRLYEHRACNRCFDTPQEPPARRT